MAWLLCFGSSISPSSRSLHEGLRLKEVSATAAAAEKAMDVQSAHLAIACEHIFSSGLYSDITFRTGEDSTPAHRCILAALSPVFRSMFTAGLKEQETSIVDISDMSTQALRAFLRLLYSGHLDEHTLVEHGVAVLAACHKYCLPLILKDACISALCGSITVDNCLRMLEHAELYNEEKLATKCRSFISGNLSQFILANGKELASRKPELLFNLVKDKLPPQGFRELKVCFRQHNTEVTSMHKLVLPLESTVSSIITELKKHLNKPKSQLRILGISDHRIKAIYKKKDPISLIDESAENLRAEEIPAAEKPPAGYGNYMLLVHHFRTGSWSYEAFGEPFTMNVHIHDTLRRIKQRIKARLAVPNETFEKWKFAKFQIVPDLLEYVPPTYLDDNTPLSVLLVIEGCSSTRTGAMMPLGIHHTRAQQEKWASSSSVLDDI